MWPPAYSDVTGIVGIRVGKIVVSLIFGSES